MDVPVEHRGLFYPFHLCQEQTLHRLLTQYSTVHFMDYMALQLTEMCGLTAFPDRMGDTYPDLLTSGRIVQGYSVSGPLDSAMTMSIDRDLADPAWRSTFQAALRDERRFQRGLFDLSHGMVVGGALLPGPAAFLRLTESHRQYDPVSVDILRRLSRSKPQGEDAYVYEYGFALLKTAAALYHTVRLCGAYGLEGVTDSDAHYRLLETTRRRETLSVHHRLLDQ